MSRNQELETARRVLNQIIDLARRGCSVRISGDPSGGDELTLSVGADGLNHSHIAGGYSRSGLIETIGETLDHLAKNAQPDRSIKKGKSTHATSR